jgi:hypothetical protein
MAAKIRKSSDLGKIWFPSRLWCCKLISIIWEPWYDPSCYSYYYSSSSFFLPPKVCPTHFSATTERKLMKFHRNVKHYDLEFSKWSPLPWNGQNAKKIEKHKNDDTCKEHQPHIVERDKPKISKSVGQTFRSCHGNKKGGFNFFWGFFSSNFIKLCRNIHRSVWQLLRVEQIQNGGRCHGNQGGHFF